MHKKIYSYGIVLMCSLMMLIACNSSEDKVVNFSARVEASNTYLDFLDPTDLTNPAKNNKYSVITVFSVDGGTTYTDYPPSKLGTKFKVKVVNRTSDGDVDVSADEYYDFNWSESIPKPQGVNDKIVEFTVQKSTSISVTITDHFCGFDLASWAGTWKGDEVGKCCGGTDTNVFTQDTDNPNKFTMDNFWGDEVEAYVLFSDATKVSEQIITMPEQTTSEGGIASGTGVYDYCRGTFTINTVYKINGSTNTFAYNFHK